MVHNCKNLKRLSGRKSSQDLLNRGGGGGGSGELHGMKMVKKSETIDGLFANISNFILTE